jgi:hypothetical protein
MEGSSEQSPDLWQGRDLPPGHPPIQLTVHFEVYSDRLHPQPGLPLGGCAVSFGAPDGSRLLEKYGGKGKALAACRDVIVAELDFLIKEFYDEE